MIKPCLIFILSVSFMLSAQAQEEQVECKKNTTEQAISFNYYNSISGKETVDSYIKDKRTQIEKLVSSLKLSGFKWVSEKVSAEPTSSYSVNDSSRSHNVSLVLSATFKAKAGVLHTLMLKSAARGINSLIEAGC